MIELTGKKIVDLPVDNFVFILAKETCSCRQMSIPEGPEATLTQDALTLIQCQRSSTQVQRCVEALNGHVAIANDTAVEVYVREQVQQTVGKVQIDQQTVGAPETAHRRGSPQM